MTIFQQFNQLAKLSNCMIKPKKLIVLSLFFQCTACSLGIDVEPKYTLETQKSDTSSNELDMDQFDAIVNVKDSEFFDQGIVDQEIVDQGDLEIADMSVLGHLVELEINPRNELGIQAEESIVNEQIQINLPAYAGFFGDQAGDMAGDMAGDNIGGEQAGEEQASETFIDSPIQAYLPYPNCIIYDLLNDRCIQSLNRSRDTICTDWQTHYEMLRPLPWSGDRTTCQVGTYHQQGFADFENLLNLYRRLLNLDEVEVSTNSTIKECALAHDIVNRDNLSAFDSDANCYSAIREQAYNLSNRITLIGNWSLYNALYTVFGLTRFTQDLSDSFPFRQYMLSSRLSHLTVGGRGRAVCLQTEEAGLSSSPINLVTLPAPGENPFALIKDGNHNGRVPWSFTITEGLAVNPQVTLSKLSEDTFIDIPISLEPMPANTGELGFVFVPTEVPEASVLYRMDISWESESGMQHYQVFSMLGLCGLGQPDECTPLPDSCVLNGSHCALLNVGTPDEHWGCLWDGPVELGGICDGLGNQACIQGTCVSFNQGSQVCAQACDTQVANTHANSCAIICPNGYADTGAYGLCP